MNNNYSPHIGDELLLRALDGELPEEELAKVQEHIEACWSCRGRREQMEHAISRLISWRNKELARYPPPPPGGRQRLLRALAEQPAQAHASLWRSFMSFSASFIAAVERRRAQYLSGAIAVLMLTLFLLLPVVSPPTVAAAVLLERARLSRVQETLHGHRAVYQRVEIRSGHRVQQREVVLGRDGIPRSGQTQDASWLPSGLASSPISWNDPLGVDAFEQWRDGLAAKKESVQQANHSLTLLTSAAGDEQITAASLTVRGSDWHPIAKRIEFRDQPALEVREIAYEVREVPEIAFKMPEAREPGAKLAPEPRSPETTSGPTDQQLEESEVRLREALHSLGADRTDVYQISREKNAVGFRAPAETPERIEEIAALLRGIPYVNVETGNATVGLQRTAPSLEAGTPRPTYPTQPPLAKQLWEYSGGMEPANNYMAMIRDLHRRAFSAASALRQLAERYPSGAWEQVSPQLRDRILRIAADDSSEVRSGAAEYLDRLSPVLDEMLRQQGVSVGAPAGLPADRAVPAACEPWQPAATDLSSDLLRLQDSFRRLFLEDQTDQPLTLNAGTLLREAAGTRDRLQHDLSRLCLPDQPRR